MATNDTALGAKLKAAGYGSDNHALRSLAVKLLKKNDGDPAKCLGKFIEQISKPGADLVIALVGRDVVRVTAMAYLGQVANELNPGAQVASESQRNRGAGTDGEAHTDNESHAGLGLPVPITTVDGVPATSESQPGRGPVPAAAGAAHTASERQTRVGRTVPLPAPKPPRVTSEARVAVRKYAPLSAFDYKIRGMHRTIGNLRLFEIPSLIAQNHQDSVLLGLIRDALIGHNDRHVLIKQAIAASDLAKMIKRAKEAAYVAA